MALQHHVQSKVFFFILSVFFLLSSGMSLNAHAKPAWKDVGGSTGSGSTDGSTDGSTKGRKNKATEVSIVSAPESIEVEEGELVTFSVVAQTNDGSNLSYAWFFNGSEITGATADYLIIEQSTPANAGQYQVVVSARGVEQSANASLSVIESQMPTFYPIDISLQPVSASMYVNESITFNVSAMSETPMQYQWRKDGQDIEGAIQSYYAIDGLSALDNAQYDVVITNGSDFVVSSIATLTVNNLPTLNLSWDLPMERVDGTPLNLEEISGFSLYMQEEGVGEQKMSVTGTNTTYKVGELARGNYLFSIATVDASGIEGPRSEWLSFDVN
jgi:hypothetical protein